MSESPEERMANNKVYSVDAFAAGIKSNHPEYAEVDNQELVGKMLEKYPQYRTQVDYAPTGGWQDETPKKKDSTELPSVGATTPTDSALPTETPKRDAFKIIDNDPMELSRLWNRAIAGSETGKIAARSFYGGSIDFEELAYYNKVLEENAPKAEDWLAGDEENVVGSFLLDIVRTIPESLIGLVDSSISPEAAASAGAGAAAGAAVGTVFAPVTAAAGGAAGAAFAGSGMLTFGSTLLGKIAENGIDITNPKALEAAWNDEEFISPLVKESAAKAGIVGSFDALSAGLGGAVAKGVAKTGAKKIAAEIAEYTIEGSLGASGEALGSLAAGDEINWRDVALEGLADPAAGISGRLVKSLSSSLEGKLDADEQDMLNKFEKDPEGFDKKMKIFKVENAGVSKEIKTQIDELNGALKTAPKKQRATILKEIQKLEKQRTTLQKESLDALDNMPEEDLTALSTLAEEITELSESTKSEEMTDSQKAAVGKIVEQKSKEIKAIREKSKPAEEATVEEVTTDEPVAEEPVVDKPAVEEPVVEQTETPVAKEKVKTKPAKKEKAPKVEEVKAETPEAEATISEEESKKKLEAVAKVRAAAPKSRYSGVKSRMKSTERGYKTVIEKTDKRTGKVTRYEGDVFVNPKTGKVAHTVTEFVDGKKKGEAKPYKDVKSFRDAINKKIKAGAKEGEAFAREYDASPEGKSAAESARVVEFSEEKAKTPVKSKRVVEKVTYKRDGKIVELRIKVNGSNRQRQLPFATVTNVTEGGKARRFETKQQYDKYRNEQLARRSDVKVETISETVMEKDAEGVFVKQEAPTEVKGVFKKPVPVEKGTTKTQRKRTTRKPFQPVVHAQVPQESRVYIVRDGKGNDRLFQKTIGKDGEFATYEVEEKTFAGGVKRYEIKEGAKAYEGQREFIKALRDETAPKKEKKISDNRERSSLSVRTKDRQEVSNKRGVKPFAIKEAIAKAKDILRTLSPDVVFITHENTRAFNEAMTAYSQNGVNERSAEGGRYIYNTATGAREIHINLEFATASTPIHEAFHAFFDKAYNQDTIVAKDLAKVLYVALRRGSKADKAIAKKLEGFIKRYDESVQSEEFLAELAGIMSEAEQTLSKPMIQKLSDLIKKFLLKLANKAGIDNRLVDYFRYDVLSNEAQQEAVQFMRSFINANSDSFLDPMNQPIALAKNQDVKLESVVKEMSELTDDYKKESKGFLLDYFQSGKEIKKGIATGRIKFKAKMSELDGKAYVLHQPDNASVGIIKDENGNVIGENFGGMLFPERFKGAFWASTRSAAIKMASDLNAMRTLGDGKIRMVLTAGTQEKLFSSTAASRNVGSMIENYVSVVKMSDKQELSMYNSVYDKIFRKAGELNKMIDRQAELTDLNAAGKISNTDLSKLNEINEKLERLSEAGLLNLKTNKKGHVSVSQRKFKTSDDIKSVIYNVKDADVSIFPLRKDITSQTISSFVASLDSKQKSILIDKFGYEKVSGLEIRNAFSEILSEPAINGVQTGMAYAVLETSSEVEATEVVGKNAHPSYPYQIRLKDPKAEVTIKILEKPENPHDADHYDFSKDFNFTNQLRKAEKMTEVQLTKHSKLLKNQFKTMFPPTSGMSQILFRNINKNAIEDINNNVDKIEPYKNLTALQKFRAKNKKKYSDFYTRERSQLSPEEQQLFDEQESVSETPNLFAKLRSRRGLRDMFEGLGQFAEEKGLVFTETQKKVRTFLESMNSQLSFSALAVRKHASRLRRLTKTPEALAEVRAYITESNPEAKQAIAERIEKMPKGDAILATADSMRAMIDNLSQVFLDNPMFDSLPERAFKEVQSYKTKDGKTMYRVVNTKTGGTIDSDLTKAAADKVANAPSIKDSIRANLGSYLHTSYRFFSSKDYKITDKAKRKAYEAEYEVAKMNEFKSLIKDGKTQEEALEILKQPETINRLIDEATESINKYVSEIEAMREDPDFVFTGLSANSIKIPKTALQQKKGIPEHIAELLGREKDPVNSFIDTAMVMNKTIFKTQMVKKISDAFGGDFVRDEITEAELNSGNWKKVKDQYSPINGKYVKTEIFEMLQSKPLLQAENAVLNAYFKGLKVMRKSKVVWNLPTWRKNLTGGMFFIAANGVINPAFLKDFKNRIDRTRKGEANPEIESLLKEMSELGLIGADVNAGLIDVNDAAMNVLFDEDFNGAEAHLKKVWTKVKNTDAKLAEKYAAIDDYTKLIIYRVERESFAKKLYGKDYASLTETQQTKVRDEAGEFVKQNTPTFSRLPKWYINSFSKVPLGDFLGFKLESWRSITANLRNATADIKKSSDTSLSDVQRKEYLAAGRRRMMGSIATLGARAVVPVILTSMFLGDDDEEIAEDALAVRPDWMEGHSLIVKNISDDGVISVYNYSMEDPYGEISDALMGDLTGFADFMSPNMFVKLAVHLTEGRDAYGRDLYDKSDPAAAKFAKVMGYTTKSMIMPPSLVSTAKYQENQMLIRDYKYNLGQQFYFTAREYTKGKPYNELKGRARENRIEALDDVKRMYDSVQRVAQHKGNASMMLNASKVLNRFNKIERAYIRGGFLIEE